MMLKNRRKNLELLAIRPTQTDKTVKVKRVPFYNWLEERD